MRKVKAVTLIELLIVLMLLSFTMGVGYYSFSYLQKQVSIFIRDHKQLEDGKELQYFMVKDLNSCSFMLKQDSTLLFIDSKDTVTYHFQSSSISRYRLGVTFEYPVELNKFEVESISENSQLIQTIRFTFTRKLQYQLEYTKQYSAEQLLNFSE